MKHIRQKSLSKFLKIALNTIYYFGLSIFVILLAGLTFSFVSSEERAV